MTDEQIEKALECCADTEFSSCHECPVCTSDGTGCIERLCSYAFCLIKRQRFEIALLNKDKDRLAEIVGTDIAKARAEAIREFAERIKEQSYESNDWSHGVHPLVCDFAIVEEIAEEITEEQK
jgi:hypothetical protein